MSGSACAGEEGIRPTAAIRVAPDRAVMSRLRPFCTSGRSPLHVVRLPGELTDSGTTFALPPLLGDTAAPVPALRGIHPRWDLVPRLPDRRTGPRLSAAAARIRVIHCHGHLS